MFANKILHLCTLSLAGFLMVGRWSFSRLGLDYPLIDQLPELRILALWLPVAFAGYYATRHRIGFRNRFQMLLFAFIGWMCLSSLWSIQPADASAKLLDGLLLFLLFCSFSIFSSQFGAKKFITLFANYYFILLAALTAIALSSGNFFWDELGSPVNRKVFAVGSGPNVFGRNMSLLTVGALLFVNSKRLWLPILLAGIPASFVLLSGSRGALLELLIALGITLTFMKRHLLLRLATPILLLIPLLFTGIVGGENAALWVAIDVQRNRIVTHTIENFHDSSRTELLTEAYRLGMEHPVVGAGLGGYELELSESVVLHYPHNMVAESWAEGGAIGLILMLLLLGYLARYYAPRLKSTWGMVSAAVMVSGIFSMLSGDLYDARTILCFSLAWSLLYNTPQDETDSRTRPPPAT
ncbi:MAG TPA: O-antigen ligase domain-containing protein [Planctomycetes bacterium]|nr:O-antigen ligase domain-containing protein [Planctomycetota bacterium]